LQLQLPVATATGALLLQLQWPLQLPVATATGALLLQLLLPVAVACCSCLLQLQQAPENVPYTAYLLVYEAFSY
jgi:hypothetical protein